MKNAQEGDTHAPVRNLLKTFAATHPAKVEDGGMRRSLAGLKNVRVVVERFKPAQEQAGFDGTTFQTDVEQLRSAGITPLTGGSISRRVRP